MAAAFWGRFTSSSCRNFSTHCFAKSQAAPVILSSSTELAFPRETHIPLLSKFFRSLLKSLIRDRPSLTILRQYPTPSTSVPHYLSTLSCYLIDLIFEHLALSNVCECVCVCVCVCAPTYLLLMVWFLSPELKFYESKDLVFVHCCIHSI